MPREFFRSVTSSKIIFSAVKFCLADWKEVSNDHHDANVRTYQAAIGDETYSVSFFVDEHGCYDQPIGVSRSHR